MAAVGSSPGLEKHRMAAVQLTSRLRDCWSTDIDWEKYPKVLQKVKTYLGVIVLWTLKLGRVYFDDAL